MLILFNVITFICIISYIMVSCRIMILLFSLFLNSSKTSIDIGFLYNTFTDFIK